MKLVYILLIVVVAIASLTHYGEACGHVCSSPDAGPVLGGVDFVALKSYFQAGKKPDALPVLGNKQYAYSLGGYQFLFQSQSNMNSFVNKPEDFYPQLGGYCSWGLTGFDIHVDDPSGYCLAGACLNSTNGVSFLNSQDSLQNFWYLKYEAKYDMEHTHESVDANIAAARKNFDSILAENGRKYCFNTDMLRTCK